MIMLIRSSKWICNPINVLDILVLSMFIRSCIIFLYCWVIMLSMDQETFLHFIMQGYKMAFNFIRYDENNICILLILSVSYSISLRMREANEVPIRSHI